MPTDLSKHDKRFIVAGCYYEGEDYSVSRPGGCHDWLLIYTTRGSGTVEGNSIQIHTQPHDAILIGPNTPHRYQTHMQKRRWELLWVHFVPRPAWRPWLRWPQTEPGFFSLSIESKSARKRIRQSLSECVASLSSYRKNRNLLAQNSLESALLWLNEVAPSNTKSVDPRIAEALEYISTYYAEPLSIPELAKRVHLSESRLAHLFSQQVGVTPGTFLLEQRIETARQLLEWSEHSVAEIARRVGIADPFYFSRRFRQSVGMSPRQFRKSLRDSATAR